MAKQRNGDVAGGNADIAAAKGIRADIAEAFARYDAPATATVPAPARAPVPASASGPASPAFRSAPVPAGVPSSSAAACKDAETHWKTADEIRTLLVYQDHLARFPNCAFATLARFRIEALKKK
jgi:hypothetical protein